MITADALSRLAPTNWSHLGASRWTVLDRGVRVDRGAPRLVDADDPGSRCKHLKNFDAARGLLFVHVPKTGGTAVSQALVASRGGPARIVPDPRVCGCRLRTWPWMPNLEHLTEFYALQLIRHCVHQAPRRIVSFAVVRDPHAVRVSAWHYLRASPDWRYAPSFNEYIESGDYERLPQDQGVYGSTFARPQSSFVGPCTLLFQYERLPLLWDFLRAERYYPHLAPLLELNAARREAAAPRPTSAARATIERVFADDFALWRAVDAAGGALVPACANVSWRPEKVQAV